MDRAMTLSGKQHPRGDEDDPCRDLAQALNAVVHQAIKEAVVEAVTALVPQILDQVSSEHVLVMDVPEAAARIGLSESKVKRLIAAGEIASISMGRRRKVPVAAVEDYLRRLGEEQLSFPGMDAAR
jgi:excisionase family DNA binding protein